jgi:hypothetical protein
MGCSLPVTCIPSMYGVLCAQVVWYYRTYLDDRRSFKIIVSEKFPAQTIAS